MRFKKLFFGFTIMAGAAVGSILYTNIPAPLKPVSPDAYSRSLQLPQYIENIKRLAHSDIDWSAKPTEENLKKVLHSLVGDDEIFKKTHFTIVDGADYRKKYGTSHASTEIIMTRSGGIVSYNCRLPVAEDSLEVAAGKIVHECGHLFIERAKGTIDPPLNGTYEEYREEKGCQLAEDIFKRERGKLVPDSIDKEARFLYGSLESAVNASGRRWF